MMKAKKMAVLTAAVIAALAVTGCVSSEQAARQAAIEQARPIRTEPAQRPEWADSVPYRENVLSFTGISRRYTTNIDARSDAMENGRIQLVEYYGTQIVSKAREYTATYGLSSDVLDPQIAGQALTERLAQNVSQALAPVEYYTEVYLDDRNREAFQVYVLMQIDRAQVARAINGYGEEKAADYARQAAAEADAAMKQQLERAAEFFGGNLSSGLDF